VEKMKKMADIPKLERPREKLQGKGAESLSDLELLAILVGKGTKNCDVLAVAEQILKVLDPSNQHFELKTLQKIEGVGLAKATLIAAALEFARRRIRPEGLRINSPTDVLPLMTHWADRKQEHFICVSLNGLLNKTQVHPREVFADPITDRAAAIIVAHNHPSGELKPSQEDVEITKRLRDSGETLGVKLLDHIIFSHRGYYSFLEHGEIS
jgi:DNA repair protein RadC